MSNKLEVRQQVDVSGIFQNVEVLRSDGTVKFESGAFRNLITDAGLERLATTGSLFASYCRVGTGATPPSFTDAALQNQIASTNSYTSPRGVNVDEGYCWARPTYTFSLGAVVGNISELGIGWTTGTANTLFSRALILDQFGNPTTITLLEDEQLRVTWEHRRYWPTEDATGQLTNEGNKGGVYDWVVRASNVGGWLGGLTGGSLSSSSNLSIRVWSAPSELGEISGIPSGSPISTNQASISYSIVDSRTSRARFAFTISQGNEAEGLQSFTFAGGGEGSPNGRHGFQARFNPPLLKTANDILQVDFTLTWGRA